MKKKKQPIDIFVSKDQLAMMWFVLAVITIISSAAFAYYVLDNSKKKPQYILLDGAGTYYLPTALDFENATDLHRYQTQLACETFFNRSPNGFDAEKRLNYIFSSDALKALNAKFLKEKEQFKEQNIHQKVEIEEVKILRKEGTTVLTSAKGQLIRVGVFNNESFIVTFDFKANFVFVLNPSMRSNGRFPTICKQAVYRLKEVENSDS